MFTPDFSGLLVANLCFGYAFSSFLLLPKYLDAMLGAGPAAVGLLTATHGAVVVAVLPRVGAAVDRRGRRAFLVGGALLMALASSGYIAVGEVGPLLYALRVAQAVAFALVFAAGGALAVDLAPDGRLGQAIGLYGLSFLSMNAIAPALVESLAGRAGWALAFSTAVLASLLCAALAARLRDPVRASDAEGGGDALRTVALRPGRPSGLLVVALVGAAMSSVFSFYQLYARRLGIEEVSAFFVAYSVAALAVRAGLGPALDRWGNRRSATAALALYPCVVLGVVWLDALGLVALGAALGVAHGIFYPNFNAAFVQRSAPGERGKLMSLFQAAFQVGMAGGGLGFGLVADAAGYPAVFAGAAAGLVLAFAVLVWSARAGRGAGG